MACNLTQQKTNCWDKVIPNNRAKKEQNRNKILPSTKTAHQASETKHKGFSNQPAMLLRASSEKSEKQLVMWGVCLERVVSVHKRS